MHIARTSWATFLPRLNQSPVWRGVIALLTVCASGDVTRSEEVLNEKPLATCAVQQIAAQANDYEMSANVVVNGYQTTQADPLANYSRAGDGQWQIPQQVDRANPWVRLLVLGPERPTLVDIAVYVESEPYTAAREKLIDDLLEHATVESLVREAVSVPVPEETTDVKLPEEKEDADKETETLAEDSEKESEAKKKDDADNKEAEKPGVEVKRRAARTVAQRLVNYMASSDVKADREEVRWLLVEWTGGPAILTLGPAMNWQRVGFAPLWNALDVDGNQSLSAAEIAAATERLSQADVDENSIVELEELFAMGTRTTTAPHSYPLLMVLDEQTNWQQLNSHLQAAYGRRATEQQGSAASNTSALLTRIASGDPTLTPTDLETLLDEQADVRLRVSLGGQEGENEVALLTANPEEHSQSEKMVTVSRGAEYLEFSAGELKEKEALEPAATQIAIGAAVDGYPLFRLADRNGDRRLSPRECRNLPQMLAGLDLNGDGQIDAQEKPTAIRIAITRGPHAHEMLDEPTAADREYASGVATPSKGSVDSVPAWFTDMDRNRDGDVSRSEFLGTSEQFRQLDRDGDGLLGSQETTK